MAALASLVGLGLGVLAADGLEALLKVFGVTLPSGPLVFQPRTVVAGLVVGVGVTVVSAISPARRAVQVPPVAAWRITVDEAESPAAVVVGCLSSWSVSPCSPSGCRRRRSSSSASGPWRCSSASGCWHRSWPGRCRASSAVPSPELGVPGSSAGESMRSPRRTAQTASAPWSGSPWSPPSPSSAPPSRSRSPPASTMRSMPTTSSPFRRGRSRRVQRCGRRGGREGARRHRRVDGVRGAFDFRHSLSDLTAVSTDHLSNGHTPHEEWPWRFVAGGRTDADRYEYRDSPSTSRSDPSCRSLRADGALDDPDRGDLPAERVARELCGR